MCVCAVPGGVQCLWSVVAAVLHLGDLEFKGNGQTHASFQDPEQALTVAKVYTIHTSNVQLTCVVLFLYRSESPVLVMQYFPTNT